MVATYVSSSLSYSDVQIPTDQVGCRLTTCAVSIPTHRGKQTNLVNVYYPNGSNSEADVEWLYNLETNQNSWVVAGDFNVSHKLWDTGQTKDSGDHLANTILNSRLVILNDGSFTRIGQPGQGSSAIDLTLTSPDLSLDAEWTIGTDHLQSDYLPLHLVLHKADPTPAEIDTSPKFLYHKADWELLTLKLTSECENHDPRDLDINTHYENIRSMILRAAEATIPKKSPGTNGPHQHSAAWWNEECAKSTRAKRRALRHFQKNLSESNKMALSEATKHCEATTEDARKDHWERFCKEEINGPEDSSKMWRKIRQMRKQRRRPERPLLVNGQLTKTSQEKADALANTFSKTSQSNHLPPEMKEKRRNAESTFSTPPQDNSTSFNSDLTLDEVRTAVASLGTNSKATGTDPISYHMIRRFPEPALRMLHTFFQTCWTTGNIPKDWKKATVVAIPKNGKPPQQTSSYRPIALTPHLGKVYERVLKNRLDHHLEKNEILPLCQAGFRKGRNCIEDTKKWSLKGKNKKTVATFFDIKKAFDSVWHAKLLNKMGALGITGWMYNFIQTFMDSREITVKVGPSVSRSHILDMGVPQGSVIAPTLFSIMLHNILTTLQPQNKPPTISLFADDLAIWSHISDHAITNQMPAFQRNIDSIQNYMSDNGFELSAKKTTLMVFAKTRIWNYQGIARIKVGDHIIRPSKQAKFLGVTLTPTFSWTEHINGLITKAMRGVSLIKMLTQETWVTPENLTHLTAALVCARLTYGHEAYFNAPKSQWQRLASTELMALKHALGVCRGAVNDLVYQEVGWLPLKEKCSRRCANFEICTQTVNNTVKTSLQNLSSRDTTFRKHLERKKPAQHKRTTPLHDHTKVLWEKSNLNPEDVATAPISPIPPWELIKPRIIDTYKTKETKHRNPLYLATLAKTRVHEEFGQHLQIYTDGSVKDNGEVGCALVIPDLGITKKYHLNNGIGIYTAELYAILKACETINDMPQPPRATVILTDSKSSLQGLASGRTKNRQEFQAEISFLTHQILYKGTDLTLMWLPSHTGIKGNELADKAAKRATEDGTHVTLQLSTLEMKNKIRQTANNIRNDTLKTRCTEHGWVFIPMPKTSPRLTLPRKNQKLLRRIRTGHHRSTSQNITCQC
ncbi:hypothetical protein ACOMHN_012519 [Nucella lapillus]